MKRSYSHIALILFLFCFFVNACKNSTDDYVDPPTFEENIRTEKWCRDRGYDFINGICKCPDDKFEFYYGNYECRELITDPDELYSEYHAQVSDCICEDQIEKMWVRLEVNGAETAQAIHFYYKSDGEFGLSHIYTDFLQIIPMANGLDSIAIPWNSFLSCYRAADAPKVGCYYTGRFIHPDTIIGNVRFYREDSKGTVIEENCRLVFYR